MRAAVISEPKSRIALEERDTPSPGRGEVLIRVRACGVCFGDLLVQQGLFPGVRYPVVPGHEVAGIVETVGEGVEWPPVGTRVGLPWLFSACGHCRVCLEGDEVMCAVADRTGMTRDGGWQEYMLASAAYVTPLPDGLDFAEAAPIMCAGLTPYTGLRHSGLEPGGKVAVIGLGGLGHLGVLYARAMGGRVAVLSTSADKESLAHELGAERFINTKKEDAGAALLAWDGGADVILATAPSVESMHAALPGLAPKGTLVIVGVEGERNLNVSPVSLTVPRKRVMGSGSGSRKELREALALATDRGIRPHVTPYPLQDAQEALEALAQGRVRGRAVLLMD